LFDTGAIATLLDQHQSGERDHSAPLWTLSMMESFLRQVEGAGHRAEPAPEPAPRWPEAVRLAQAAPPEYFPSRSP
jgi:hypothetical protein